MTNTIKTVRELLAHYLESHEYGVKQNTIDCWLKPGVSKLEKFLERPAMITDLNLKTVNSYIDWLKANSSSTEACRSRRGPILLLVRYANDLGLISKFEGRIRKVRIVRKTPRGWTSAEVQTLLKRCLDETVIKKTAKAGEIHHNSRNANVLKCGTRVGLFLAGVVAVAWDSTLRLGDVLELKWSDLTIDYEALKDAMQDAVNAGLKEHGITDVAGVHHCPCPDDDLMDWRKEPNEIKAYAKSKKDAERDGCLRFVGEESRFTFDGDPWSWVAALEAAIASSGIEVEPEAVVV